MKARIFHGKWGWMTRKPVEVRMNDGTSRIVQGAEWSVLTTKGKDVHGNRNEPTTFAHRVEAEGLIERNWPNDRSDMTVVGEPAWDKCERERIFHPTWGWLETPMPESKGPDDHRGASWTKDVDRAHLFDSRDTADAATRKWDDDDRAMMQILPYCPVSFVDEPTTGKRKTFRKIQP